jgi:hypothetical protein
MEVRARGQASSQLGHWRHNASRGTSVALLRAAGGGTLETRVNERGTRCSLESARSCVASGPRSGAVRSEGATHCCRQTPHGQVRAPPATTTTGSATPPAAVAASARVTPAAASSPLRTSRPAPIGRGGREGGDLNPRPSGHNPNRSFASSLLVELEGQRPAVRLNRWRPLAPANAMRDRCDTDPARTERFHRLCSPTRCCPTGSILYRHACKADIGATQSSKPGRRFTIVVLCVAKS